MTERVLLDKNKSVSSDFNFNLNLSGSVLVEEDLTVEALFLKAIDEFNNRNAVRGFNLSGITSQISYGNAFSTSKKLCKLFRSGIISLFGPTTSSSSTHAMSICDAKEMPYIATHWFAETKSSVINMHPHPSILGKVLRDLVIAFEWKGFTILYESGPYLSIVTDLLQLYGPKGNTITVRRFDLDLNGNYRNVLRRVRQSEDKRFVIVGSINVLPELLKQAQQIGLMTEHHQYVVGNLDFITLDLEPFQHSGTNITGLGLVDPDSEFFKYLWNTTSSDQNEIKHSDFEYVLPLTISVNAALTFDGILLLGETLTHIDNFDFIRTEPFTCNDTSTWERGLSLVNYLKTSTVDGLTGKIKFDNHGFRTDFNLGIVETTNAGLKKVGVWNSTTGLKWTRYEQLPTKYNDDRSLQNTTVIVLTALSDPYGMLRESPNQLYGNERFEGFGIDLIHELSLMIGFNYTFELIPGNSYGSYNETTRQWNGMIGELIAKRAHLAITDLTMTSEREKAVDFTMPFMNLGISILYRKPTKEKPKLFSFMSPFSNEVWLYLGASYIGVSLSLFILGRLSPAEWDNPYPCVEEPTIFENQFSLRNSLWFTIGALLQQGSEIAPKAPSTRTVASIWWFFTLIMVSSYTANLAAFLTVESLSSPINSAEDLANGNGGVKYGAKKEGSTINFFKEAKYPTYVKMYEYMKEHPDLLPLENKDGKEKAQTENYAFLMESTSIEYTVERNCDLTQIGNTLDEKGYGIAMPKLSKYRDELSQAVLRLQEQGKLASLKNKWWKEKRGGGACADTGDDGGALALEVANLGGVFVLLILGSFCAIVLGLLEMCIDVKQKSGYLKKKRDSEKAEKLGLTHLGGVFFVLLVGSTLASCFGICEWFCVIYYRARSFKTSFKEEFLSELKFFLKCSGNTKPTRIRKSSSLDSENSSLTMHSTGSNTSEGHKICKPQQGL